MGQSYAFILSISLILLYIAEGNRSKFSVLSVFDQGENYMVSPSVSIICDLIALIAHNFLMAILSTCYILYKLEKYSMMLIPHPIITSERNSIGILTTVTLKRQVNIDHESGLLQDEITSKF
jgi:hypothetical protein